MTSADCGQGKIEHRRKRGVEAEGLHCACNQLAVLASERRLALLAALQRATACAEGSGASASRSRSTVPPSTSTQRRLMRRAERGGFIEQGARLGCVRNVAAEEDDAAGRTSLSHARSRPVSSVPARPTTSRLPAAWRKVRGHRFLLQFLLQLFQQIQGLQRRERVHVGGFDAIHDALRERREDGQLHRLGVVSTCTLCRSCFSCWRSTCLARSMTAAGRPASRATSMP